MRETEHGLVPEGDGWFVVNARDLAWETIPGSGTWCVFESPDAPSDQLGIGIHVLMPGEPSGKYHAENQQEGFFVLEGECIVVVEGEERRLRQWDYFHCAPGHGAHHDRRRRRALRDPDGRHAAPGQADPLSRGRGRREVRRLGRDGDRLAARGLRRIASRRAGAVAVAELRSCAAELAAAAGGAGRRGRAGDPGRARRAAVGRGGARRLGARADGLRLPGLDPARGAPRATRSRRRGASSASPTSGAG